MFSAQERSANQEVDFVDVVGMFTGFGFVIWVIVRGIKIGRLAKSKNLSNKPTSIIRPKIDFERLNRTPKQPSPPKQLKQLKPLDQSKESQKHKEITPQPPKPALKEDFELGDDNLCQMHYKNSKGEISTRTILIRTLKANKNGDWFVSAVDIEAKRLKSFRVDGVISLSHNNQIWTEYDDVLGIVRTFETLM